VREDEFARYVQLGRDNADAIELVRRHCRHARVEMPAGNSWVGSRYDLPMGRLEVRCQYASAPRTSGHRALELAVEFYRDNCAGCPHRQGTGELPNLATIVAERDTEAEEARQVAERVARERTARHRTRTSVRTSSSSRCWTTREGSRSRCSPSSSPPRLEAPAPLMRRLASTGNGRRPHVLNVIWARPRSP